MNLLTIMYIVVQEALNDPEDMSQTYSKLRTYDVSICYSRCLMLTCDVYPVELNPSLVDFMMLATSKLRWDEQNTMPHTQVSMPYVVSLLSRNLLTE